MTYREPKILIVHDWLNTKDGGAERVLYKLLEMYPSADLSVLIYDKVKFGARIGDRKIKTSFLQYFPQRLKSRPHLLLPFVKRATESINTKSYDLVIASSSAWVKNVRLSGRTKMLVYCYSPARMLWDYWPRALTERTASRLVKLYVTRLASKLRLWDYYTAQDSRRSYVAISKVIARRIKKFYHREAIVIYPPVSIPPIAAVDKDGTYLVVSVLAAYKNIDVILNAFFDAKQTLLVAGDGPERDRLQALAAGRTNIRFLGRISEADKLRLMRQARGFIFANIEDFGITPVEAIACGAPVIALRGGGVSETMVEGVTAEFFEQLDPKAIRQAIERTESRDWSAARMHKHATRFSDAHFRENMQRAVEKAL